jgi:hypothetical protein
VLHSPDFRPTAGRYRVDPETRSLTAVADARPERRRSTSKTRS